MFTAQINKKWTINLVQVSNMIAIWGSFFFISKHLDHRTVQPGKVLQFENKNQMQERIRKGKWTYALKGVQLIGNGYAFYQLKWNIYIFNPRSQHHQTGSHFENWIFSLGLCSRRRNHLHSSFHQIYMYTCKL